jgi:hypothetical protein
VKKTIYAITLILLGGALIIQAVWGADVRRPELEQTVKTHFAEGGVFAPGVGYRR